MNVRRLISTSAFALAMMASAAFAGNVKALVSVLPQQDVVSRIGGNHVDVIVMIPQGADPHEYSPKPSQLKEASEANMWFTVGVPVEKSQLDKIKDLNKDMKIIPYAEKVEPLIFGNIYELTSDGEVELHHKAGDTHVCHSPECNHDHTGTDPHSWLSPKAAVLEAETVRDAFIAADPENKADYEKNYAEFVAHAQEVDKQITELLKDASGKTFMTFHPAWGYFARDYNLNQLPIEVEGKEPSQQRLVKLIEFAKSEGVKAILVEPQFSNKGADVISKELGIPMLIVDPLSPNWGEGLVKAAEAISKGVR